MQFIFEHTAGALLPFLHKAGQHIKNTLSNNVTEIVMHKCKFVLTELCTNGIKHSGEPQSIFDITISEKTITIQRTDAGAAFFPATLNQKQEASPNQSQGIITLSEDDINRLNMQPIDSKTVRFFVDEVPSTSKKNSPTLGEHFGLIIICQSSNNFTYTRLANGENQFRVSIALA